MQMVRLGSSRWSALVSQLLLIVLAWATLALATSHSTLAGKSGMVRTTTVTVAENASILYYNAPAAVQSGKEILVGYTTSTGSVEVARVDGGGRVIGRSPVHQYASADDHAAPALWIEASGDLLVATSHHSSSLFLYRLTSGRPELICKWEGSFTYPRFSQSDEGLRLLIRSGPSGAGDLVAIGFVEACSPPATVIGAAPGNWIYATPPQGALAWNIYRAEGGKHADIHLNGRPFPLSDKAFEQAMTWSVSPHHLSVVQFGGAYACCHLSEQIAELYAHDGSLVFQGAHETMPYYPNGISLAFNGDEGLFPVRGSSFERRSLPDLSVLASCPSAGANAINAQYVRGGNGAYVWVGFEKTYLYTSLEGARVMLCIVE